MRYSDYQQRKMDAEYSKRLDQIERKRKASMPCKNKSQYSDQYGGCLRCAAECGEACRDPDSSGEPTKITNQSNGA